MMEQWLPISKLDVDFTGLYEISNFGRVKSLPKSWYTHNHTRTKPETILNPGSDPDGYFSVVLCKNKFRKTCKVHLIVWDHFGITSRNLLNIKVDHIDNDKSNNAIWNLQLLGHRENCIKRSEQSNKSLPPGVSICSNGKGFKSRITIKGKEQHLGIFNTPEKAAAAYNYALRNLQSQQ